MTQGKGIYESGRAVGDGMRPVDILWICCGDKGETVFI
jgi:hypothetical protein